MANKKVRQRLIIFALCYLAYIALFSADSGRNLSGTKRELEFVHITETGGNAVEKAAALAGINWGACHYISLEEDDCAEPDYELGGGGKMTFISKSTWHIPPSILNGAVSEKQNPYSDKDLFTIVRNPYTRLISEFYSPYTGFQFASNNDASQLNQWILSTLKRFMTQKSAFSKNLKDGAKINELEVPYLLAQKHLVPQAEYVYGDDGVRVIGNVIHFEDLAEEFKALMGEYGLNVRALNMAEINNSEGLSIYDLYPDTIAAINEFYKSDFEAFGYVTVQGFESGKTDYNMRSQSLPCKTFKVDDTQCIRDLHPSDFSATEDNPIGVTHSTTFLLGIFTDMSKDQRQKRDLIRATYLKNHDLSVCSLKEYIEQTEERLIVPCRVPYIFVVGGDENRPPSHEDKKPLEIDRSQATNGSEDENDIVYLNIKENSDIEKSQAYFKWAQSIGTKFSIDFVGKVANSTLLDLNLLVDFIDLDLPATPFNRRMYGGSAWGFFWEGGYYGTSPFYFMSLDLATFVSDRKADWTREEAHDIGRMIFKHPKPVKFVNMNPRIFWFEDMVSEEAWMDAWNNRMGELPLSKPNMENHKICQSFKDEGLFTG